MKQTLIIGQLICLLMSIKINAQESNNYIEYAKIISKAETYILEGNFENAFPLYDSIFSIFNKCFPNDAFIAAQAASLENDFSRTYVYYIKGVEWGLTLSSLNYFAFNNFNKSNYKDSLIIHYDEHHKIYESRINNEVRNKCISMLERDQNANKTHRLLSKLIKPIGINSERKLSDTAFVLLEELKTIIRDDKIFPSHENIGVFDIIRNNNGKFEQSDKAEGRKYLILSTIFWHYPYFFQENEELLEKALINGDISAWQFALARDFAARYYQTSEIDIQNKLKYKSYKYHVYWIDMNHQLPEKAEMEANKYRSEIGLYSLYYERLKKKLNWNYNQLLEKGQLQNAEKQTKIYYNYYFL